jgi:hypothetical protein
MGAFAVPLPAGNLRAAEMHGFDLSAGLPPMPERLL